MKLKFNLLSDEVNKNGVLYPKNVLKKVIEKYNNDVVKKDLAYVMHENPLTLITELTKVAKIIDIQCEKNSYVAEVELLDTDAGNIIKEKLEKSDCRVVNDFSISSVGILPKDECA